MFRTLAVAALLASVSLPAVADGTYFDNAEDGWFWYEDPPAEPEEPEEEPAPVLPVAPQPTPQVPPPDPTDPGPPPGSVAWLRQAMPAALDAATDYPTEQNVERYLMLQKMALDKSERFSDVVQQVTTGHPQLDEGRRRPRQDTYAKQMEKEAEGAKVEILSEIFQTSALILFVDRNCAACGMLAENFFRMEQTHGLVWQAVSLDGTILPPEMNAPMSFDQGIGAKLGVSVGGAVMLATPPDRYTPVTWNPTGGAEIADRVLLVARRTGLITDAQFAATRVVNPMVSAVPTLPDGQTPDILQQADDVLRGQDVLNLRGQP